MTAAVAHLLRRASRAFTRSAAVTRPAGRRSFPLRRQPEKDLLTRLREAGL